MTWELLLPLIARYGIEWVRQLVDIIEAHPVVTKEALDKVLALSQKPMSDYLKEAKERLAGQQATS